IEYNLKHNITPKTIEKNILDSLSEEKELKEKQTRKLMKNIEQKIEELGDIDVIIQYLEEKMLLAAQELRFEDAAYLEIKLKNYELNYNS
ncbi:MAG TPA: excinuclease ABC subunit B, partial [Candidatus Atribacteria bacterium]|nr:excinuclease ABC subunit B [Candidatus Atribacteria bacterium]